MVRTGDSSGPKPIALLGAISVAARPLGKPLSVTGTNGDLPRLPQGALAPLEDCDPVESPFVAMRIRTDAVNRYKRVDRAPR